MSDWEFYQQLKQAGVIVVPGSTFFPGFKGDWSHQQQCVRISLTASHEDLALGMQRLAEVTQQVYCT
jgi:valine--pyruvate aminotransferase